MTFAANRSGGAPGVDVPLVGAVKDTIDALMSRLTPKTDTSHLDRMRERYVEARQSLDELATNDRNRAPMHPQFVAKTIDDLAADDAVFLPDVGTPVIWAARYLHMNGRRRLVDRSANPVRGCTRFVIDSLAAYRPTGKGRASDKS